MEIFYGMMVWDEEGGGEGECEGVGDWRNWYFGKESNSYNYVNNGNNDILVVSYLDY